MSFFAAGCRFFSVCFGLSQLLASAPVGGATGVDPASASRIAHLGVPFVENRGQTDPRVAFLARTFAGTVFVTRDGRLVYSIRPRSDAPQGESGRPESSGGGWAISESFVGQSSEPVGLRPGATRVSDLVGADSAARKNLPTYERVGLGEIAPGIRVELRATGNNVEKLFTLAPGADPNSLRVRIAGGTKLAMTMEGALSVQTGAGDFTFTAPIAYQDRDGVRTAVDVRYQLDSDTAEYGFALGSYDRSQPLVIDPLIRSTYSGGGAADSIRAMLVHPGSGEIYVAGATTSATFPGATGPVPNNQGGTDAFVARYTAGLTGLQHSTFFGGPGEDSATAIGILPSSGNIYIAGRTTSASGLLHTAGTYGGNGDAFILRFDGALSDVLGATYFGGTQDDGATGLAVDILAAEVVMVGGTRSLSLPVGAFAGAQPSPGGGQDGFVARFSATLGLIRTSFIGGSGDDQALAVAVDPLRSEVIVAGVTQSANFPDVANGALPTPGGLKDGFVARFDRNLSTRLQSTYFGGTGDEQITAIAVHPYDSHIYVTGDTSSTNLRGRLVGQTTKAAGVDAFVAHFYPELTGLHSVTYYGSDGDDFGTALAISPITGEIYIAGQTTSSTIPGAGFGVQPNNVGSSDAFVTRFDIGLSTPMQATLLGGGGADKAYAIALTDTLVYVAGEAGLAPPIFRGVGGNSAQETPGGGATDGFIGAMTTDLRALDSNPAPFAFAPVVNVLPLTVQVSSPARVTPNGVATIYVDGQPGSAWCASTTGVGCSCDLTGNVFRSTPLTLTAVVPYYVCVRHISAAAPNVITESTLHIGATAATFRVGTGIVPGLGCTLDMDGNGATDALTDGLMILRALFNLSGSAVTNGAIGLNATRQTWSDISAFYNANCGTTFPP
jgi:hypothetical protein